MTVPVTGVACLVVIRPRTARAIRTADTTVFSVKGKTAPAQNLRPAVEGSRPRFTADSVHRIREEEMTMNETDADRLELLDRIAEGGFPARRHRPACARSSGPGSVSLCIGSDSQHRVVGEAAVRLARVWRWRRVGLYPGRRPSWPRRSIWSKNRCSDFSVSPSVA